MKRIVVYTSKTGFTAKYAKWIAEELGCEEKALKEVDMSTLKEYDQVIYGGWLMGGMVSGLDKIRNANVRNLVVFGCGMAAPNEEVRETVAKQNQLSVKDFFYLEGGYKPEKVGFLGRMMIKMVIGSICKKENKTEDDLRMLETAKGADRTKKDAVVPLVAYVNCPIYK